MSLLQMSLSGAVMILVIAVIRAFAVNRLPKKTFSALWGATLIRLLIPYSLPSAFSVYSLLRQMLPSEAAAVPISAAQTIPAISASEAALPQAVSPVPPGVRWMDPRTAVWLTGSLACALFFTAAYLKFRREFRESLPVRHKEALRWLNGHRLRRPVAIRQSDRISAPLTYGVFRPVILMPKTADWENHEALTYVLAHEYVHIRRFDAVTKLLLTAAFCVHWWNPAVWLMYVLANRDLELSCDEAVIRMFGERAKTAYARTLLYMEEIRSGMAPLCNHFSRNAIEERIVAIMKIKKTSLTALVAAVSLIGGITTAFATSAKETPNALSTEALDRKLNANVETALADSTLMSYRDPVDGKTYYSWDQGATWTPLTEEEFEAIYPAPDVEWWTAEEYEAWLEKEKQELQTIIGAQGWTPSTGWFTWTQEKVNESIRQYEQTLQEIKDGKLISKPADDESGNTSQIITSQIIMSCDPKDIEVGTEATDTTEVLKTGSANVRYHVTEPSLKELLESYGKYGISFDSSGKMLYNGKAVHYFVDGVEVEDGGWAVHYSYTNEEGTEYLRTVRSRKDNGDGSYDPFGPLTGIVSVEDGKLDELGFLFQGRPAQEAATDISGGSTSGLTFAERFAKYKEYGITYVEAENASGAGNVYLNGQLVRCFSDVTPEGSAFSFHSVDLGGIDVHTIYAGKDKQQLAGVVWSFDGKD